MTENENTNSTNKPQLANVINFETDIAPHPLVSIWAGVGAGKNYFVEQMVTGSKEYKIPQLNVLIITSRKAKVAETLSKNAATITQIIDDDKTLDDIIFNIGCDPRDYRRTIEDDLGCEMDIYQRSVVCSNAYIEKYLKYRHHPLQPETHLWNRFDVIVWDEAHALRTDSSYQTAPYHVMKLMKETYERIKAADENEELPETERNPDIKRPICKHLIFMSGTPEAIETIPVFQIHPVLDVRKECVCVMPRNIHFLTSEQATLLIREQLQQGERIVYFLNHTLLPKVLSERFQISSDKIAVSFSKEEMRKSMEIEGVALKADTGYNGIETEFDRMISVENQLTTKSLIRSDIQLFATTSRNKEGININDADIHHIYVESHSMTDIRQMAGRIRAGAEHLYIILDSEGYNNADAPFASYIAKQLALKSDTPGKNMLSQLNTNLKEFCQQYHIPALSGIRAYDETYPKLGKYIDQVKKLSPYFEFDYLSNEFRFNNYRKKSKDFYAQEIKAFNDALGDPTKLEALFQEAFPEAKIHAYIPPEDQARKLGWDFMYSHPDGDFTAEELDELLSRLDELLTPPKNRKRRKSEKPDPNRLLHRIDLHLRSRNNKPSSQGYDQYILEPHQKKVSYAA